MESYNIIKIQDIAENSSGLIRIEAESKKMAEQGIKDLLIRYPKEGYGTIFNEPRKEKDTGLWFSNFTIWSCE